VNDGQIIVRVALEKGPRDTVTEGDWTDLTDRVRRYSDSRGRDDVLQPFGPGTAEVGLFNGDRMLDPSNPDGLLFNGADPIGLPLCPVQITQWWDGTEYPKFTGYLGPEAWPGDVAPYGESGTVTLHVMDALGHSPNLPPDMWGLAVAALHPDWWSRMDDFGFPVLDPAGPANEVPNSIGDGYGTLEGTTGIYSQPFTSGSSPSGYGINDPGLLLLGGDHLVRFPASEIMPDGDQDKVTMFMWWSARTALGSGEIGEVARFVDPADDSMRLRVYVDGDDGHAYAVTYDASETIVDSGEIDPTSFGFSRFDTGDEHMLTVRWDAGTGSNCTVWFGGISATLAIPGDLYESDLLLGPADVDVLVDEVAIWREALRIDTQIEPVFMAGGFGMLWGADQWIDRLAHFIDATGRLTDADDTNAMHFAVETVDGLWGLIHPARPSIDGNDGNYSVTLPNTLADAYQITVESAGGTRWADKDNNIRARSLSALTDVSFAEHYAEPVTFTDADGTLGADEYRHAGVEVTGLRIDRVINFASIDYMYCPGGPPEIATARPMTCVKRDEASIARYGLRSDTQKSEWCDWLLNQFLVDLKVDRFAQPHQEFERIHLDPLGTGDDALALAEWLVTTCELELACSVTYTSAGADPVTISDLNIQHISTEWTPERWSVDLVAAKS
jgi:hypothetical protein